MANAHEYVATHPERFQPLHDAALAIVGRLEAEFDVDRSVEAQFGAELLGRRLAQPAIKLTPRSPVAAPIVIALTTFPGLLVKAGRWHTEAFPVCGCDRCHETTTSELDRFQWLVECVTAGAFREAIRRSPLVGAAWRICEVGARDAQRRAGTRERLSRARARALVGSHGPESIWRAWPRRATS